MPTTYAKRYTRPTKPPNFELTRRAIEINTDICRHPLIRFDQLHARYPDISYRPFRQIVTNLFKAGFIAQPKQQQELHNSVPGSLPTYLSPDRLGIQLHEAFFADPLPKPKYTQDNDRGTWSYMRHQHTTSRTMLDYEAGASAIPDLTYFTQAAMWTKFAPAERLNVPAYAIDNYPKLMAHDFIADPPVTLTRRRKKNPLHLSSKLEWPIILPGSTDLTTVSLSVTTYPDEYFGHQLHRPSAFFRESDEGTETILPGRDIQHSLQLFRDTSLLGKYLIYIAAFRSRSHQKQFGLQAFKVLNETTTPVRTDQIIGRLGSFLMAPPLNIHSDFLLHTDRKTLSRFDNNPYHPDH